MHDLGMQMSELLLGRRVTLYSPLPADEIQRKINSSTGSMLWPFCCDKIIGGVALGFIRLAYQSSPIEYNAKSLLSGRLRADRAGTLISARFGVSALMKVGFAFYYLVLGLIISTLLLEPSKIEPGQETTVPIFFTAFLAMPVILHLLFTRNSAADLERIVRFLDQQVQAKPI